MRRPPTTTRHARRTAIGLDRLPEQFVRLLHDPSTRQRVNQLVAPLPPPDTELGLRCFGISARASRSRITPRPRSRGGRAALAAVRVGLRSVWQKTADQVAA
jgi:hypothetical protein